MKKEIKNINPDSAFQSASLPKRSLLSSILSSAGQGLFSFAKFSGLVITTSVADIEEGLLSGGKLHIKRSQRISKDPENIPEWHIRNELFSCFYLRSKVDDELRESLHMIRIGWNGGAILKFTDGKLVAGVTNGIRRAYFSPEEELIAKRILESVKSEIVGVQNESN